jgi:long-chain fatty acid transport protein
MRLWTGLVGLLLAMQPGVAHAGSFDVFGYGARGMALGGAMTAVCDDYTAVYYNPAGLSRRDVAQFGTDLYVALPSLDLTPTTELTDPSYAPASPPVQNGAGIGAVFPILDALNLGVAIQVPWDHLLSIELLDPQIPQWYRYDALPGKVQLGAGLGYRVLPWLHVGLGVQSLAALDGGAEIELDPANEQIGRRDLGLELIHTVSPTAGIVVEPPFAPGLTAALSYRGALHLNFGLPILFHMGESLDLTIAASGIALYTPHEFNAGLSWDLAKSTNAPLILTADMSWSRWSLAPRPSVEFYLDLEGELVSGAGAEDLLDFRVGSEPAPDFRDTVTVRGGAQWTPIHHLALRTGYAYRPSALGPATGFSNYVDSDAHMLSLGAATQFPNPIEATSRPLTLEFATQLILLDDFDVKQETRGPVGDFGGGGHLLTFALTARQEF